MILCWDVGVKAILNKTYETLFHSRILEHIKELTPAETQANTPVRLTTEAQQIITLFNVVNIMKIEVQCAVVTSK